MSHIPIYSLLLIFSVSNSLHDPYLYLSHITNISNLSITNTFSIYFSTFHNPHLYLFCISISNLLIFQFLLLIFSVSNFLHSTIHISIYPMLLILTISNLSITTTFSIYFSTFHNPHLYLFCISISNLLIFQFLLLIFSLSNFLHSITHISIYPILVIFPLLILSVSNFLHSIIHIFIYSIFLLVIF